MTSQIDPDLIKGQGDDDFDMSLGLMYSGHFKSTYTAAVEGADSGLDVLDFRVVQSDIDVDLVEVFVKTAKWQAWKANMKLAKEKAAFKEYWKWFPIIFITMPVLGSLFGGFVAWYSFSGQLEHQGFLSNPTYAFWCSFIAIVVPSWGMLAWNGIKIKLGDYS